MRLGVFGGSFDPVHVGHLSLARACQIQAALDEVWFTPTAIQPLKKHGPQAPDADRVEMLRLAVEGEPGWRVCTLEVDRGGPSYTIDTLRQLYEELPDAELYFLIGADAVRDVPKWREPAAFLQLATLLIVHRAGEPTPDLSALRELSASERPPMVVEMPLVEVSSSEVRRRIAASEPIDGLVPESVANYIADRGLYRARRSGS